MSSQRSTDFYPRIAALTSVGSRPVVEDESIPTDLASVTGRPDRIARWTAGGAPTE